MAIVASLFGQSGSHSTVNVKWNAKDEAAILNRRWCDVAHYTGGSVGLWVYSPGSAA